MGVAGLAGLNTVDELLADLPIKQCIAVTGSVDQQGRIRGYFDGETPACIPAILAAIQKLKMEP